MKNKLTFLTLNLVRFVFVLAISYTAKSSAQQSIESLKLVAPTTNESIFVHANATTFVPGETLLYKVYAIDPKTMIASKISKIAYAELISSDNKKMATQKLYVNDGFAQGDLFIPTSLPTGSYKFICYTNWMLNKSVNKYFEMDIFVINPFETNAKMISDTTSVKKNTGSPATSLVSSNLLKTDKSFYAKREKVNLKSALPAGNYSVSVRKRELLPMIAPQNATEFVSQNQDVLTINFSSSNIVKPELRGELITGMITSKSGKSVEGIKIGITAQTNSYGFKIGSTDANGRFYISLDQQYPQSTIIAQVIDENRADFEIALDSEIRKIPLDFNQNFVLTSSMKKIIEERSVASQIENAYATKRADSLTQIQQPIFFEPLGKDYKLDEYTRFPTFKETIVEVVSELYFTQNVGKYELHLRDYNSTIKLYEPILTLVDGVLLQNVNELFDYKMADVDKITILPGGYFLGAATYSGIVNIVTKEHKYEMTAKGDYIAIKNTVRPMADKIYFAQDYSKSSQERIPDYRIQLFWQPKYLGKDENISFYTSDVEGIFDIIVAGFSNDGTPIFVRNEIEVK